MMKFLKLKPSVGLLSIPYSLIFIFFFFIPLILTIIISFWDYNEYSKYIWIREALTEQVGEFELVFLFQKPYAPMPQAKKRKDGTKRTHAEWAETNNFTWYSEETLPEKWK